MSNCELKILIVDDSELILQNVARFILEVCDNIQVVTTLKPSQAFEIIKKEKIEIVIMDTSLETVSGIELLKCIKEDSEIRTTMVLMLSSLMDKFTLERCFEYGAVEYLQKPIEEIEFKARLKSIIRTRCIEKESVKYLNMLQKQNSELKELNQQLADTHIQLLQQEKLAAIGQLAAGVAHEINNPLGFIISNTDVLNEYLVKLEKMINLYKTFEKKTQCGDVDAIKQAREELYSFEKSIHLDLIFEDINEIYGDTSEGLHRIGKIVKNLRNFSRLDLMHEVEIYSLNEGIDDTLTILQNELKFCADIEVNMGDIPHIEAISSEINQVLLNLLINARDAIKEKYQDDKNGTIKIETSQESDYVILQVEDNGIGIPVSKLSSVLNPFFTTKPVGVGTGLGLSITHDIVTKKHQGLINIESEEGNWTRVTVKLPFKHNALVEG